jgi:hypothetical protein
MPPFTSGSAIDSLAKHYNINGVRALLTGMKSGMSDIPVDL